MSRVMTRIRALLPRLRTRTGDDSGQVTAFVVILTVALVGFAGLVLDAGMALSAKVQALDAAQAAAQGWLSSAGLDGTVTATTETVTVTVRRTTRTQLLQLVGVSTLTVSATATATAIQGVNGTGP